MQTLERNIALLVISRAGILVVVLILTLLLGPSSQYIRPVIVLACLVVPLTFVYIIALQMRLPAHILLPIQFTNDVLLVTWLVYRTGDVESPFNALYLVVVFGASMLPTRQSFVVTSVTVIAAVALGVCTLSGTIPRSNLTTYSPSALPELQLNLSYMVVAIAGVAILSTHLADRQRRSDTALAATARSLASLRAFNERIIESMRSGLITADSDGYVTGCNRAAQEILGLQESSIVGRPVVEFFGESVGASLDVPGSLQNTSMVRGDISRKRPDGSLTHLGFNVAPLLSEQNDAAGIVLIFQDLTEVFELEQEVRRREKLAALGTMAAGLAHEIRNPLASIRGSIQVLSSELPIDEGTSRLVEIILRESERLNRTVTDFLTYSRPSPHAPSEFDLKRTIAESVTLLRNSPEVHPGHTIEETYPPGPCPFVGDSNQIRQIFWNLARNGLQAMPDSGRLMISIAVDRDFYKLKVSDQGVGMAPDQIERVFEPFASKTKSGTGLGLAIVYQFVTDHNGRISLESTVGEGTTVTVSFPMRRVDSSARRPASEPPPSPSARTRPSALDND